MRGARQWASEHVRLDAFARSLRDLVVAPVAVQVRRMKWLAEAGAFGAGVAVAWVDARASTTRPVALVQAEPALVADVVARATQRTRPTIVDAAAHPSPALAGAFGAIVSAAARRAHGSAPSLRVVSAGAAPALEAHFSSQIDDAIALTLTVLVGDEAYAARLLVARHAIESAPPFGWDAAALSTLGILPLAIPLVACVLRTTMTDAAALRVGDVVILGGWPLAREGSGWCGPLWLAAPESSTGVRAQLGESGSVVLRGETMPLDAVEADMVESDGNPAIVDAVGEIPVVVRVEIGEARMAAKEWASLGRGDVVALGQRVGSRVALRVAGVVMARGELVDIDGEIGVRVLERVAAEPSRP